METLKFPALVVAFVTLASCSDGKDNLAETTNAGEVSLGFDHDGFPGARLSALIEDVVEPGALSEISLITIPVQIWLDSIDANIPPEYFTDILAESDAVSQTFACDSGSVSRKKWGNPTVATDSLLFDACEFEGSTFNGSILITNQFPNSFCTGGPFLGFEMADFNLVTASGNQIGATGKFHYTQGVHNCGSAAGGPVGFFNAVNTDISFLSFGADNVRATYSNFRLLNIRREISADNAGDEHAIELSVSIDANFLNEQVSEEEIDIRFTESMKVTSAVAEPNRGILKVGNGTDQSVTYAFISCAKDMAVITTENTDAPTEEITVAWTDDRNVLAKLSVPGVRDHMTGAKTGIRESTYDANQSIEGC